MTQYRPFNKPNKIDYIKEETIGVDTHIENLKNIPDFQGLPAKDFYKNAKLIYESGWSVVEHELIPEATAIETGVLLPERALYNFSVPLSVPEDFLPYLKIEVIARTNPDILIEGVYPFLRGAYKPVQVHLYNWWGITYTTGCQAFGDPRIAPAPEDMYTEGDTGFFFKYQAYHHPVPIGENETYVVPHPDLIGYDNAIKACEQSTSAGQYWEDAGIADFQTLVDELGYEGAKDVITDFYDGIVFTEQSYPALALEVIEEERVVTGHQVKKFLKQGENNFTLIVDGSFLQISPSVDETTYSNKEFPTYQPNGGDMEVKLNVYSINPNVYSERKFYTK